MAVGNAAIHGRYAENEDSKVPLGRALIIAGLVVAGLGVVITLASKSLPLGRLPGDFVWRGKNTTIYLPLGTSLLLSVAATVILWLLNRK
jgi:hypothetical protein